MIVFKLVNRAGLSYSKEHSFGDKSRPADFIALHIGFVRIIRPIEEEAFSKYFKMYLGDDYEWHHKVRKEIKKQRSKLTAYYDNRHGENLRNKQEQISSMHKQILGLKEDVRALVRSTQIMDKETANENSNANAKEAVAQLTKSSNKNDKEDASRMAVIAEKKSVMNQVYEIVSPSND